MMEMNILCGLEALAEDGVAGPHISDVRQQHREMQDCLVANYAALRRKLTHHLGCADMASESLHDAWLRLGRTELHSVVQNPEAYVYRVACNVAMDRLRNNRSWQYTGDTDAELENTLDHAPGPDLIVEARSEMEAVERAMERLPYRHRSVLISLRIEEKTRQEVARQYDLSLRSVDTILRQGLDYCAQNTGREVAIDGAAPRRSCKPPWIRRVDNALCSARAMSADLRHQSASSL